MKKSRTVDEEKEYEDRNKTIYVNTETNDETERMPKEACLDVVRLLLKEGDCLEVLTKFIVDKIEKLLKAAAVSGEELNNKFVEEFHARAEPARCSYVPSAPAPSFERRHAFGMGPPQPVKGPSVAR